MILILRGERARSVGEGDGFTREGMLPVRICFLGALLFVGGLEIKSDKIIGL